LPAVNKHTRAQETFHQSSQVSHPPAERTRPGLKGTN